MLNKWGNVSQKSFKNEPIHMRNLQIYFPLDQECIGRKIRLYNFSFTISSLKEIWNVLKYSNDLFLCIQLAMNDRKTNECLAQKGNKPLSEEWHVPV